ncbi:MAG: hypothetical protein ACT4P1_17330 [Sporichthyaceae bacterium]
MLEDLRQRLRSLIPFIQKEKQKILYTDFEDTIGEATEIDLSGIVDSFEKFRRKTRYFLREHLNEAAVGKLYGNQPIGVADLDDLKSVLLSAGLGTADDVARFYESPFTDVTPHGPEALFDAGDVGLLLAAVHEVRRNAEAA